MDDTSVIVLRGLTKVFGDHLAVDRIDLVVRRGELFGLVGPDGGGKTTVMRMLAAIMEPTSGEAWVAGHSILREGERVKETIGYMSQRFGLYEDLTVLENMEFYADLYEVPRKERPPRIERLLGFSNLTPFRKRLAGELSGGMKQKLGLACALVHTPEVLFLDEPTNGVDPVSRRDFWKILYELLREGITIFLTTAYLDEAERCSRIGLIHNGRLLVVDQPGKVRASLGMPMIQLWVDDTRRARELLQGTEGIQSVSTYGGSLHVALKDEGRLQDLVGFLEKEGIGVEGSRTITPSLEDIFIAMVR
ncbi:MAG: ABC transporter ATP-binding protein [Deltaproteobacteria bacterium]|nr:ABC transporter ATP-binding protein [Deltaproteobacteria bacterium]